TACFRMRAPSQKYTLPAESTAGPSVACNVAAKTQISARSIQRPAIIASELQAQAQVELPRAFAELFAEGRRQNAGRGRRADVRRRIREIRMVEGVDRERAESQPHVLANRERFGQGEVPVDQVGSDERADSGVAEPADRRGARADRVRRGTARHRKSGGIEHP